LAIKGKILGCDFLKDFSVRNNLPMFCEFTNDDFERILSFAALESFADANEAMKKDEEPLGDLAISLVEHILLDPFAIRADDLPSAHPITYAHG
jgi:hypothetical protein